jgi:esterase/lipase
LDAEKEKCREWSEYYREFPYLSAQRVRPGCHPGKLLHAGRTEKAIVLVHGLTDSPHYMMAIAEYFHEILGYNVYLPLLQCHGLKQPEGMAGVSLAEWKKNVRFALGTAAANAERVSIGGLSTGGALAFYFGCADPAVTGDIYLFSAALGLYAGRLGVFGGFLEFLARLPFVRFLDSNKPLVGKHRYRYDRVPFNSAGELARLIQEIDGLLKKTDDTIRAHRIFAAWSEHDRVINIEKLKKLPSRLEKIPFVSFSIPKADRVDHACVVLPESLYAMDSQSGQAPLERANPRFAEMLAAVNNFESAA